MYSVSFGTNWTKISTQCVSVCVCLWHENRMGWFCLSINCIECLRKMTTFYLLMLQIKIISSFSRSITLSISENTFKATTNLCFDSFFFLLSLSNKINKWYEPPPICYMELFEFSIFFLHGVISGSDNLLSFTHSCSVNPWVKRF